MIRWQERRSHVIFSPTTKGRRKDSLDCPSSSIQEKNGFIIFSNVNLSTSLSHQAEYFVTFLKGCDYSVYTEG
jgi:hypothetical protein